ncbi:MAG: glycerophosphodiester phosphodiesterase [Kofleriaceae bacterium]
MIYAHRGAPAELPENTLASFQRAVELGVDALELDVHTTRDGVVVVSHDPDARRMAGVDVRWLEVSLAEARRLDLGRGFVGPTGERPFAGRGITIPTFEEVLVEFPAMRLNVDLKQASPPLVEPVLELLRRLRAEERVTLASFRARTMYEVRRRGYRGPTALAQAEVVALLACPRRLWRAAPLRGQAVQIPVAAGRIRLDRPAFISKCHDLGLRVDYWTIDDPEEAKELLRRGADGIMTDDPARMVAALRPRA